MPNKNRVVNNLHSHTSRVIHSSMAANVSTNWRSDYHKFKGYSYAQVLKNSSSMGQNQNKGTSKTFPNFVWPSKGTCTRIQLKSSPKVTPKGSQVKTGKYCPHLKIGRADYEIPCFNRFLLLERLHTVVEPSSNAGTGSRDSCDLVESTYPMISQVKENKQIVGRNQQRLTVAGNVKDLSTNYSHQNTDHTIDTNEYDPRNSSDTKYDLPLRIKNKVSTYKQLLPNCPTLQAWDKQNKFKFGFIPLGTLKVPTNCQPKHSNCDPLVLHKKIKDSGDYNFMKSQITVRSQLNPEVWESLLTDYWHNQLCSLMRFGFPLDFQRDNPLKSHLDNHTSTKIYPQDVEAYLAEEIGDSRPIQRTPIAKPPCLPIHD